METSSGLFVFKDRIVCVCVCVCVYWKTTHYDRSGKEMFTSLSEAALWWRYPCFLFECLEEHAIRSLKARGDRMSVCRGTWDGFTPFLSCSRRIMKPSHPFLKRASAFLLNGPARLHLFLLWKWKVPPQCAPLVMKKLKRWLLGQSIDYI